MIITQSQPQHRMRVALTGLITAVLVLTLAVVSGAPGHAAVDAADHGGAPIVRTEGGAVRGVDASGVGTFLGIPYAAPPIGDLRWRAPRPASTWRGIRDATAFAPSCPQQEGLFAPPAPLSEDCLYLNVYTPAPDNHRGRPRPVIVWIHGGGLAVDAARNYVPTQLAADGTVVVTINYRLGALGALAHPALASRPGGPAGNYGLMDQQAALRWVQRNIDEFGGDPHNVTIAGESAGGLSVLAHLVSPGSRGLFRRAIVQSGTFALTQQPLADAEAFGQSFAATVGCADQTAQCLRNVPVDTLVKAFPTFAIPGVVDGKVLTESIGTALAAGRFARVPILNGSNHDEEFIFVVGQKVAVSGGTFVPLDPAGVTEQNYLEEIKTALGVTDERAAAIAAEYPTSAYLFPSFALSAVVGDANFACTARQVDQWTSARVPTFAYEFNDDAAPARYVEGIPFATHGAELPSLFDLPNAPIQDPFEGGHKLLAASMRAAWARFAATGDPSTPTLRWPSFRQGGLDISLVPPQPQIDSGFAARHHCAFWGDHVTTATKGRSGHGSTPASAGCHLRTPAVIGRTFECQTLEALVDAVHQGRPGVLVLRGPSGIGKTTLLDYLVATAPGLAVARATGSQSEMELPFAGLHQLCAPWLGLLAELPEPQWLAASTAFGLTAGPPPDRLLVGLAASSLLDAVSGERPLLCVVDDAQWLDRDSTRALAFVARRLRAGRVALVFATRVPLDDVVGLPELLIGGLDAVDAHALLTTVLHSPVDEGVRARIVTESGGNPRTLIEWPTRLAASGLAGGFADPLDATATGGHEATVLQQVVKLPTTTRRFLTVAAAEPTGDPIIVWRAANVLGLDLFDATPAVEAGLIEIGTSIAFRHPHARTASYGAAARPDRQAAHRALAEVTDPDVDPDRRAWHRALGSPGPDEAIAEALERSVCRAQARGGSAAAAVLLERSVALTAVPARRARRVLASAAAHLNAGSFDRAGGLLAMAAAAPLDEPDRAQLDVLQARHATCRGDLRTGTTLHERAAARLEPIDIDLAYAAHLEAMGTSVGLDDASTLRAAAVATLACPRSTEPTELESLAIGLARAIVDGTSGAAPVLRRVLARPHKAGGADECRWLAFKATAARTLWDFVALRELAMVHVERARAAGALSMLPSALNTMANVALLQGELEHAASAIGEATEILQATRRRRIMSAAVKLASLRADDDAAEWLDEQVDAARLGGPGVSLRASLWARATLANGTGEYDTAFAVALEAIELPRAWSMLSVHELIEAALRSGHRDVAISTMDRLVPSTTASGSDWALGIQDRCRALLADDADADHLYLRAIGHLRRTHLRPELARTHLLYGEWLRRAGRRVDARAELQTAHDMCMAMGIDGFADRCRHELLSTGASVRKRTVDANRDLTSQELEVARLALDGLSNAEIGTRLYISVRTVEWHLRKVFAKLGIASRRELTTVLSSDREHGADAARMSSSPTNPSAWHRSPRRPTQMAG